MKTLIEKARFYHFAAGFLFLFAFIIRLHAIHAIHVTNDEAVTLFSITGIPNQSSAPFLQQFIVRILFLFTGNRFMVARMVNVLLGSALAVCPFLYRNRIGVNAAFMLGFFLALDPFFIANSALTHGHNLSLILGSFYVACLLEKRYVESTVIGLAILISGYAFTLIGFIILSSVIFLSLHNRKLLKTWSEIIKNHLRVFKEKHNLLIPAFLVLIVLAGLLRIDLSTMISDLRFLLIDLRFSYPLGETPQAFFWIFLSYLPLTIVIIPVLTTFAIIWKSNLLRFSISLILIMALIIFFNPAHRIIDLIWVSLPVWVGFSLFLSNLFERKNHFQKIEIFPALVSLVLISSIFLFIGSIINRIGFGASIVDNMLSIIVLVTFLLIGLILYAYLTSIRSAGVLLGFNIFIIGMVFQIAMAARSAAMNGRPQYELIWNGYFTDADIMVKTLESTRFVQLGTRGNFEIAVRAEENHSLNWLVRENGFSVANEKAATRMDYEIVITPSDQIVEANVNYRGQRFVANSYPLWIHSPEKNMFSADYWSWFFFRQSQLLYEYNVVWVKTEI